MPIKNVISRGLAFGATIAYRVRRGLNQGAAITTPLLVDRGLGTSRATKSTVIRRGLSQVAQTQQQVVCTTTSYTGLSLQDNQSPPVAVADVFYADFKTTPGGYNIVVAPDGTVAIDAHSDLTRQWFNANIYDTSLTAFYGAFKVWVNNHAPQVNVQPADIHVLTGTAVSLDLATSSQLLPRYILDQDADAMTFALVSGTLPAGVTLSGGVLAGTPTTEVNNSITITATDALGVPGSVTFNIFTEFGKIVPVLVGKTVAQASTDLLAAGLAFDDQSQRVRSATVPAGLVISQNTPSGSVVFSGSTVQALVSLGPLPGQGKSQIVNSG